MAQFSLEKLIQPEYNYTTPYLPIFEKCSSHKRFNCRCLWKSKNLPTYSMAVANLGLVMSAHGSNLRCALLVNTLQQYLSGTSKNRLTGSCSNSCTRFSIFSLTLRFVICYNCPQNLPRRSLYPLQRLHEGFFVTVVQLNIITAGTVCI